MPINKNALLRHRIIDECLRNPHKRWTLAMLVEKIEEALRDEGIGGITERSVQNDIFVMRHGNFGYNAPIVVRGKKYYEYKDPGFSIFNQQPNHEALRQMQEAVKILKQFKGFAQLGQLAELIQRLEDSAAVQAEGEKPLLFMESNAGLKGLLHLSRLYDAAKSRRCIQISYRPFHHTEARPLVFSIWWLKEYNDRWYAAGTQNGSGRTLHLALDRIEALEEAPEVPFENPPEGTEGESYYKNIVGVTRIAWAETEEIVIWADKQTAGFLETKPLHPSQKTTRRDENGEIELTLYLKTNFELERLILGFGQHLEVLSPQSFRETIAGIAIKTAKVYGNDLEQ